MSGAQDQAVLAVVRLIGSQDVAVTAQHPSTTESAVAVRIGRTLIYLNDQATAEHFHKVWSDAESQARTLQPRADRSLVRALRGMPEPGVVANAVARPPCSVAMVGADTPGTKPFLRIQLGRLAFEVRDLAAYRSCLGAFRQAREVARDVFLPTGTELVYHGAIAIACDAFHPGRPRTHATPPATSPQAGATRGEHRSAAAAPVPRTAAPRTTASARQP